MLGWSTLERALWNASSTQLCQWLHAIEDGPDSINARVHATDRKAMLFIPQELTDTAYGVAQNKEALFGWREKRKREANCDLRSHERFGVIRSFQVADGDKAPSKKQTTAANFCY